MRRYGRFLLARVFLLTRVLVVTLGVAVAATSPAEAQTAQDKVRQAYDALDGTTREIEAAKARLGDLQNQQKQLDAGLASLNARVAAATARVQAAQQAADKFSALATELQAKVDETTKQLDQAQADMKRSALLLYTQHGANTAQMFGLLSQDTGSGSIVEGKHYLERVSDKRRRDAVKVSHLRADLQDQQEQVAEQKKAADDAQAAALDEKNQLDTLIAAQTRSRDAANANQQQTQATLTSLNAQAAQHEADLAAASAQVAAQLAGSGNGGPAPSGFIRPVNGPITSGFGYRTDPITGQTAFHSGIDFGASCGTPIKAANTGRVFSVTPESASGGYGNMTILTHGGGIATLYGHQSSIVVSPGQTVAIGEVIGYVGSTGKSTGCHLHWEVRVNGTPVNPMNYL